MWREPRRPRTVRAHACAPAEASKHDPARGRPARLRARRFARARDVRTPSPAPAQGRLGPRADGDRLDLGARRRSATRRQRDRGADRWRGRAPADGGRDRQGALTRAHRGLVRHARFRALTGAATDHPPRPPGRHRRAPAGSRAAVGRCAVAALSALAANGAPHTRRALRGHRDRVRARHARAPAALPSREARDHRRRARVRRGDRPYELRGRSPRPPRPPAAEPPRLARRRDRPARTRGRRRRAPFQHALE